MKQTRKNLFETNSSSVHAIVVNTSGKVRVPRDLPEIICFSESDLNFGWESATYNDWSSKLAYLYSATITDSLKDLRPLLLRYAEEVGIHILTAEEHAEEWCGIDHSEELGDIREILKDLDSFKQFVFCSGSFVTTGNDNDEDDAEVYSVLGRFSDKEGYVLYRKGN